MRHEPKQVPSAAERRLQRLVVLELLRDDHQGPWSGCELSDELSPVRAETLATAIDRLVKEGVLCGDGDELSPSPALQRLNELELICV